MQRENFPCGQLNGCLKAIECLLQGIPLASPTGLVSCRIESAGGIADDRPQLCQSARMAKAANCFGTIAPTVEPHHPNPRPMKLEP